MPTIVSAGTPLELIESSSEKGIILTNVSEFAGDGRLGDDDGEWSAASFRSPESVLQMPDGSWMVADTRSHIIRRISDGSVDSFSGVYLHTNAQGFPEGGYLTGDADKTLLNNPEGMALDRQGNLYVADKNNNAIVRIDSKGHSTLIAGNGVPGFADGKGEEARFNHPSDVAVTGDGTIYVADTLNHVIRKIDKDGAVSTLNAQSDRTVVSGAESIPAGNYADGELAKAEFNEPSGLALDASGNLFVSDTGNQRIRYIDFESGSVSTVAGGIATAAAGPLYEDASDLYATGGYQDGEASQARFNHPLGIAVAADGGLVIADSLNHSVRLLLGGQVYTLAGDPDQAAGHRNGVERNARFSLPSDVAVAEDGAIIVADALNNVIRRIQYYRLPEDLPATDDIKIALNDRVVALNTPAEIMKGRTMVPLRSIGEALGYTVNFIADGQSIQFKRGNETIRMAIGDKTVRKTVDGHNATTEMDIAPSLDMNGRTLIPVRFFAEQTGLDVQWNQKRQTVILRDK